MTVSDFKKISTKTCEKVDLEATSTSTSCLKLFYTNTASFHEKALIIIKFYWKLIFHNVSSNRSLHFTKSSELITET